MKRTAPFNFLEVPTDVMFQVVLSWLLDLRSPQGIHAEWSGQKIPI